jgi:MOSC domain-containing protein
VDAAGRFLTQRTLPRMSLVSVAVDGGVLRLDAPGADALEVPLRPEAGERRAVDVWGDRCEALSLGDAPARWLTGFLGVACGLVYMPDATVRATNPAYGPGRVGFADAFPFLLTSTTSLAALAQRGGAVPMERFRPNIVVKGAEPFAEDGWARLRIGAVTFRVAKPCVRCAITTVDPDVGAVAGVEPLRTLATFRRSGDGVLFGMNLVHETGGVIEVGATAEVLG